MDAAGGARSFARAPRVAALPVLAVAVLPKCPLCVMLVLGALGIPHGAHDAAFALLQGATVLALVWLLARRRPGRAPLLLALAGVALMAAGRVGTGAPAALYAGALLLAAAWLGAARRPRVAGGCGCGVEARG